MPPPWYMRGSQPGSRMGIERRRWPVAWKTALPIAGAIAMMGVSPAPAESWSGSVEQVDVQFRHVGEAGDLVAAEDRG